LTLVGVGPGDPNLLTVAAVRTIAAAAVVAYPVARPEAEGMAARIAAPWIRPDQRRLPLLFPMVSEAEPRRLAWHAAADALAAEVAAGQAVVLLCEGDASLFASASYALLALAERHPTCPVAVIPGITAVAAAAAAGRWPLALQQDALLVRPTPETPAQMEALLDNARDTAMVLAVMTKLGGFKPMTTVQLQTSFLRPVSGGGGAVRVVARVLRMGRSLVFGEMQVISAADELAAHATTTYALL
jgi:precorrin-2/cobalt-factor-2 C20-methyltransferase